MNLNTLSLYLYAGGLSLSLSIVLFALSRMRPGATQLLGNSAYAILLLGGGLTVAGYGPSFPAWVTVIGTNLALLASASIFYSGVLAFVQNRTPRLDRLGLGLLALCAVAFWYWGLVEPNGTYRSVVFSLAGAAFSARITYQLVQAMPQRGQRIPYRVLIGVIGFLSLSMIARAVVLLVGDAPPLPVRGSNPTSWVTVFWYIVLITAMTACVVWVEFSRPSTRAGQSSKTLRPVLELVEDPRSKLMLLWALVVIAVLAGVSEVGLYFTKTHTVEQARLTRSAELTNEALASRTKHAIAQIDTILFAVRNFYLTTRSLEKTKEFINALAFDRTVVENVYLISPRAEIVIAHEPAAANRRVDDRDYFSFLKADQADAIFIGSVEAGRVNGMFNFRVARRISNPDGSFAGVVLATVRPQAFSSFHERLSQGSQHIAAVLGTLDRKIRASSPELTNDLWQTPMESPLWDKLGQSNSGTYTNTSPIDNIARIYTYRKVDDLPLVVVTGFSESDIRVSVYAQLRTVGIAALMAFVVVLALAMLLTVEIRRRAEQGRFLSMLSHELKTPLATLAMTLGSASIPETVQLRVGRSIESMNAVIERCLQSDRLAHGRVEVVRSACDLTAIINDVRSACSAPNRVTVEASDIPCVRTDHQLVSVVVSNLLDNALKYGAPDADVRLVIEPASQRRVSGVRVTVSNPVGAAGMPDPKRVFKKYYRAPGAKGKVGSGLGLHIAAGFARRLGGQLHYAPLAEQVKFTLWIPT